jgi:hypothetical protein
VFSGAGLLDGVVGRPAPHEADGVIAEAQAVESPLRHHRLGGDTPLPHPGSETGMSPVVASGQVPFFRKNAPTD